MRATARLRVSSEFRSRSHETSTTEVTSALEDAHEAERFLRQNVVQAVRADTMKVRKRALTNRIRGAI